MLIKPPSRTDLHAAYEFAGCAICGLLQRSERRYIDATLYEHVTDVKWRGEVREARGFCALHTEHVLEVGRSALGVSLVAADIIKTLRESLGASGGGRSGGWLRSALGSGSGAAGVLKPQRPCPICSYLDELGRVYVAAMLDDLATEDGQRAYGRAGAMCLPHFVAAAERGGSGYESLRRQQERAWAQLESELNEFARKNDYRYSGEPMTDAERDAWRRALRALAGS
jgi:hypothetical protein